MPELKIAAAYIRVSTDDQVEYSPEAQLVEIRKYAVAHGYLLPEQYIFMDEGISGRKTAKRDAFNEMIGTAKLKPKPFDAILLWKFSRFARNREDSVVYKSMLRKQLGIDVISISEPVGDDKMSVIIEAMIEAMDEYYSINLAEEVRRGMSEKARRGELQSSPPFGYTVKDNLLIPLPPEDEQIREIFRRYLAGEGFYQIAKWANAQGMRTHRGGKFENRTVEYILRNPVYIGKLRWNPTGKTRRDFDNKNIILADSRHEPLVSLADWEQVQNKIRQQKALLPYKARPNFARKDWLAGIVRCASCGGTLIFSKPHYFKCNNYVRGRCSTSQHTPVETLHTVVLDRLRQDADPMADITYNTVRRVTPRTSERKTLEQKLAQVQRKRSRLQEAFLAGADTVEEYTAMKKILAEEETQLRVQLEGLQPEGKTIDMTDTLRHRILRTVQSLESPSVSMEEKYDSLNTLVEYCTYDRSTGKLSITYRVIVD